MVCSLPLFYYSFTRKLCGANLTGLDGQFSGGTLGIARCGSLQGQRRSSWAFGRFCTLCGKSVGTESKNAACLGQQSEKLGLEAICCQSWGFNLVWDPPHRGLETSAIDPIHTFHATWQNVLVVLDVCHKSSWHLDAFGPKNTWHIQTSLNFFLCSEAPGLPGWIVLRCFGKNAKVLQRCVWKLSQLETDCCEIGMNCQQFYGEILDCSEQAVPCHVPCHETCDDSMTSFLRITLQRNSDES